jgi:hypothetical protein
MPLRVSEIDPQTDARWETFLSGLPGICIFYTPPWLRVLEETYGYRSFHLICEDASGHTMGVLPLFYSRGWRSGRVLRSVYTGPLALSDAARLALLQFALKRVDTEDDVKLRFKMMSNAIDGQVGGMTGVPAYETYMLALPERVELLRVDSAIRRAVNKALRLGVKVREAESERELRAWYRLYAHTMCKLALLPNPYRLFELAWRYLRSRGMLRLLLAEYVKEGKRKLVAGNLLLYYGQTISFDSSGWSEQDQALRANDLLHWQAIYDACAAGARWYDFGDVSLDNAGLARYKTKWGAKPDLIYGYSYPVLHGVSNEQKANEPGAMRRLIRVAWHHLPPGMLGRASAWYHKLHLY